MLTANFILHARFARTARRARRHDAWRVLLAIAGAGSALLGTAHSARAQSADQPRPSPVEDAARNAYQGAFLMQTIAPAGERASTSVALTTVGYDGGSRDATITTAGDVHAFGAVDLRIGVRYAGDAQQADLQASPIIGARVRLLEQSRQGIDLSTAVIYGVQRTGDDAAVQAVLAAGRRFGRVGLFGNLAYSQDPGEGDDRVGQLALGMLYMTAPRLELGVETKCRFDLFSTDRRRALRNDPLFESISGPVLQYALGPLALLVQTGLSTWTNDRTRLGAIAIGGVGAAY